MEYIILNHLVKNDFSMCGRSGHEIMARPHLPLSKSTTYINNNSCMTWTHLGLSYIRLGLGVRVWVLVKHLFYNIHRKNT